MGALKSLRHRAESLLAAITLDLLLLALADRARVLPSLALEEVVALTVRAHLRDRVGLGNRLLHDLRVRNLSPLEDTALDKLPLALARVRATDLQLLRNILLLDLALLNEHFEFLRGVAGAEQVLALSLLARTARNTAVLDGRAERVLLCVEETLLELFALELLAGPGVDEDFLPRVI